MLKLCIYITERLNIYIHNKLSQGRFLSILLIFLYSLKQHSHTVSLHPQEKHITTQLYNNLVSFGDAGNNVLDSFSIHAKEEKDKA